MHNTDDVLEIDLKEIFAVLMNRVWLILICGIVAGVIGFCYSSFFITPMYQSTTKVYILNKQNGDNVTYSDLQMGTTLTKDYKELIKSRSVLETVIKNCELSEQYASLTHRVSVEPVSDTRIIAITVEDAKPETAQYLADEIRKVAAKHIEKVMDIEAVNVVDEANLPEHHASPSVSKWTILGFALGICACAGVVFLRHLLDDTIKTSDDVEKYLGLSTLAMIPIMEDEESVAKQNEKRRYSRYAAMNSEGANNAPQPNIEVEDLNKSDTVEEK